MFEKFFIQPIYNVLILITASLPQPDLGIGVILLVILLRLLLWPFFHKVTVSQSIIKKLQPEIERIRRVYKDDQLTQARELLALYQKHNFNPFSSLFNLLFQLPLLIALYQVFLRTAKGMSLPSLYAGVPQLTRLQTIFLSRFELTQPSLILALIAALCQAGYSYFLSRNQQRDFTQLTLSLLSPLITLAVIFPLPSVIALYWSITTVISIFQQLITEQLIKKNYERGYGET